MDSSADQNTRTLAGIGQLTSGIAHDLDNLLGVIGGNLELLIRELPAGHDARRHALTASAAVRKGARLAGELLAFARSQRLEIRPTEVVPALMRARERIGNALGPSIELLFEYPRDAIWARTDPDQLEAAILALVSNAREAMPDGGQLRIESGLRWMRPARDADERDYVSIRMIDTGVGMSPEVLAKATEPCFTTHGRGRRTGLGLTQVHAFVHQCDGELELRSVPGEGTCIEILLPRSLPPSGEDALQTPTGAAAQPRPPIGDDDATPGASLLPTVTATLEARVAA